MQYDMVIARQRIAQLEQRIVQLEAVVEQLRVELARRSDTYTPELKAHG